MYHMFDVSVAEMVGVNAAILFQNIAFWCQHSRANGTNFHDGNYWTYSSNKAFRAIFTYMSASQIDTALKKLLDAGLIVRGNYNKSAYDRTMWYAVTENGNSIYQKSKMEKQENANGNRQNREPIPDISTDQSIDKNIDVCTRKRFIPPTVDEVQAYADEKHWTAQEFNAERFVDFYSSKDWRVGRDPMKDWKASARGWVSRYRQEHPQEQPPERVYKDADPDKIDEWW